MEMVVGTHTVSHGGGVGENFGLTAGAKRSPVVDRGHKYHPVELVAIDIDGTLLRTDKRLSRPVAQAVAQAVKLGVRVVLATARPPRSVREIYQHLKLDTYQINYNGALVYDPMTGRTVHHQPLDPALAMRIIKLARKIYRPTVVSVEILDRWYTDHVDETLPTETSRRFNPDFVGPLEAFMHVPLTKLMLLAPPERMATVRAAGEAKFAGKVAIAISDPHLLQVIHPLADKGIALERIAKHYGIKRQNVMAIGDASQRRGHGEMGGHGRGDGQRLAAGAGGGRRRCAGQRSGWRGGGAEELRAGSGVRRFNHRDTEGTEEREEFWISVRMVKCDR